MQLLIKAGAAPLHTLPSSSLAHRLPPRPSDPSPRASPLVTALGGTLVVAGQLGEGRSARRLHQLGVRRPARLAMTYRSTEAERDNFIAHARGVAEQLAAEAPGVALLVGDAHSAEGEEPLLQCFWGNADMEQGRPVAPDTIFRIFSLTKPLVSAAALLLVESGQVGLQDPISRWLPEFDVSRMRVWCGGHATSDSAGDRSTTPATRPIRVIDVLRHTSGMFYPDNPDNGTPGVKDADLSALFMSSGLRQAASTSDFCARGAALPLYHEAGERFTYSVATGLLARLVEVVTGLRFDEYLEGSLLAPLGMRDTGFFFRDDLQRARLSNLYVRRGNDFEVAPRKVFTYEQGGLINADGGMFSTIGDYARFVKFLISGGPAVDGKTLVRPALLRDFLTDHLALSGIAPVPEAFLGFQAGFGLGTYVHRSRLCGWSGLANTHFFVDKASGLFVIMMAQVFPFTWKWQELLTEESRRLLLSSETAAVDH